MRIVLIILSLLFLLIAFLGNASAGIQNPFIAYTFFQLHLIVSYLLLFILVCIFLVLFFVRAHYRHARHISHKVLLHALMQSFSLFIVSLFFALGMLFIIAWIQVNSDAFILKENPSLLGITTDTKVILRSLQKAPTTPSIIAGDFSPQEKAKAVAQASVGKANFYGNSIIPALPDFLILPITNAARILLLGNTCIISSMNTIDLQKISPVLGFVFVQNYFSDRHIKSFPKISVMTQSQFIASQNSSTKEKRTTIALDIQKMTDGISSISAAIQDDNASISAIESLTTTSLKQQDTQYNTCLSTGTYVSGKFVPTHTKPYCDAILSSWNSTLSQQGKDENAAEKKLQNDQAFLKEYQYYQTFFKTQKTLLSISTSNIPDEMGVFQPPNTIQLALTPTNTDSTNYLETLCHEYLHYASTVGGKRFDSTFFEEGLTEYFARRIIEDSMQIHTNLAYPAQVKIIEAITKRIAEPDLADMYFTKNEAGLETALNLAYGDNFYKDNFVYFESLQYTSDPQEATKITNTILKHMGESAASEKELFSD